ncbi:hypothetical protein [Lacisediminimonas profundi]|uniref:hypothetical protein n=1 Tax=Lacisediminimonas profundi TaxID=2603856 RepID=UPI00124B6CE2|nr:hypothetical protein [Lacisediminimonas profundi]
MSHSPRIRPVCFQNPTALTVEMSCGTCRSFSECNFPELLGVENRTALRPRPVDLDDDIDALLDDLNDEDEVPVTSAIATKKLELLNQPLAAEPKKNNAPISAVVTTPSAPSTISPTPAAPMVSSRSYIFPLAGRPFENSSDDHLAEELRTLVDAVIDGRITYAIIRESLCSINVELNLRQKFAPRFRPLVPVPFTALNPDEINASRDRQVVDAHWVAHSKECPNVLPDNYHTLFRKGIFFDFAAAARFACEEWRLPAKAVHLHLSEFQQWELAAIQEVAISKKWRLIQFGDKCGDQVRTVGAIHIFNSLKLALGRSRPTQSAEAIDGMVSAWKARQIVGESPLAIVNFVALMTGKKPRDTSAMRRTLESLDRHLSRLP